MANMTLVCGMSGSGKTTFAKKYAKENDLIYVNPDDYYTRINGDECKHYNFFEVWMSMWRDIHNYEINGMDILIDTNALTRGQREQFLEWFPTFKHHLIWIKAPFELCIENNNKRRRVIPYETMKKMWDSAEWLELHKEWSKWDSIKIVEKLDNETIFYRNFEENELMAF